MLDKVAAAAAQVSLADSVPVEAHRAWAANHPLEFDGDVLVVLAEARCALGCGLTTRGAADGFGCRGRGCLGVGRAGRSSLGRC